jgi:hypothetical protein
MRYPEWTIWNLPLVVHEFGHVVIEDVPELDAFAKKEAEAELPAASRYVAQPRDDVERWRNEAILRAPLCRVRQLIADAFAVHTIGPSYACSLIMLRLNPIPLDPAEGCPRDEERAVVATQMLRIMAEAVPKPPDYTEIIARLEQEWAGVLDRSGVSSLSKAQHEDLVALVIRIKDLLHRVLVGTGYRTTLPGGGGWTTAYGWYAEWAEQAKANPNRLEPASNITQASKIYDALNAAWAYRIFANPRNLEPVAKATRETCEAIIRQRGSAVSRTWTKPSRC